MNHSRASILWASLAHSLALMGLLVVVGEGCNGNSSAGAPPPGGSSCATDSTVSCEDGTGYSCLGSDTPEDSDSSLLCSDGTAGNAGSTLFCCLQSSTDTTCGDDPTVSCPGGGFGFSCSNATESPNQAYPSLTCSTPTAGNAGSATYCCTD